MPGDHLGMVETHFESLAAVLTRYVEEVDMKKSATMNGAESLVRTLIAGGVDMCFTNPGTSEIHMVAALDHVREIRCVLGFLKGWSRERPMATREWRKSRRALCFTSGRDSRNGLANLHNASRAHVPMVNLVGQHPTYHLRARHSAHFRHRSDRAALFQVAADISLLRLKLGRDAAGGDRRCADCSGTDCDADRSCRCGVE